MSKEFKKLSTAEKHKQIRKEALASVVLFLICMAWHVGFGFALSGREDLIFFGLPLWWILSVPGVFVVAVIGVIIILKKFFVNFSLEPENEGD